MGVLPKEGKRASLEGASVSFDARTVRLNQATLENKVRDWERPSVKSGLGLSYREEGGGRLT
jgi:hypothetical protein